MKASPALALLAACTQSAHAVVQFPFAKRASPPQNVARGGSKARALNTDFFQGAMTYVVNATVGTPGQPVSLVLSSSSSDTWVLDAESSQCNSYYSSYYSSYDDDTYGSDDESCIWGSFSPNVSSTFQSDSPEDDDSSSGYSLSYDFSDRYFDGSYAYGTFFNDTIALGNVSLDDFTLGLVNDTDRYIGILGLGYNDTKYPTFTDRLLSEGQINSKTYSIWVDDSDASSGSILFGAIDTTKFEGSLSRVSSIYSGYQMLMAISSINATTEDSDGPIIVTYDADADDSLYGSSSTRPSSSSSPGDYLFSATFYPTDSLSVLPDDVASQFWEIAGAYYDSSTEMALIGCNAGDDASTNFTFRLGTGTNGPNITAALDDLIVPVTDVDFATYSSSYFSSLDEGVCLFGVQNRSIFSSSQYSYTSDYSLGSGILRRTYSVFDFVNDEVAVAPVKFGATGTSNVVAFATYGSTAPSSTMLCVLSSCSKTTSSDGTTGSGGGSGGGGDDLADDILSVPALVGVSLGVGLCALSVGIIGFLIWRHRMRRRMAGKDVAGSVTSAEAGEAGPPLPPRGAAAAAGAAPGPEMTQASQPHAGGKGKAPEIPMPENLASASTHGHGTGVQDSEPAQGSSSRNA